MSNITRINGHDSQHALQELRNAKARIADALYCAVSYLRTAQVLARAHALPYDMPGDRELVGALEIVNRDLHGNPPQSA